MHVDFSSIVSLAFLGLIGTLDDVLVDSTLLVWHQPFPTKRSCQNFAQPLHTPAAHVDVKKLIAMQNATNKTFSVGLTGILRHVSDTHLILSVQGRGPRW